MRPLPYAAALAAALASQAPAQEPGFRLDTVVTGLDLACSMAFTPDGRLLVLERLSGRIVVVADGAIAGTWATVPVLSDDWHLGAMGIAVDPGFRRNGHVYVSHTRVGDNGSENAIARLTEVAGRGGQLQLLPPRSPAAFTHNIGPLAFGADGRLYVLAGDCADLNAPQDLGNLRGKVWRVETPLGGVPADNPFPNSYVYSYGHRNAFGLAMHPRLDAMYQTENGFQLDDELNRLAAGRNYGWPMHDGRELMPDPTTEDPLFTFLPQIAPTGCAFYGGPLFPSRFHEAWFVGDWKLGQLQWLELDAGGAVRAAHLFHTFPSGVYAVTDGPDGSLWVLYSSSVLNGADTVARLVWVQAPRPSLTAQATATVAVGGSVTLGLVADTGDVVAAWLGASRFPTPLPTPFGALWVPPDISLPARIVAGDDRAWLAFDVPADAALRGAELHAQGLSTDGAAVRLTNPDTLRLR